MSVYVHSRIYLVALLCVVRSRLYFCGVVLLWVSTGLGVFGDVVCSYERDSGITRENNEYARRYLRGVILDRWWQCLRTSFCQAKER